MGGKHGKVCLKLDRMLHHWRAMPCIRYEQSARVTPGRQMRYGNVKYIRGGMKDTWGPNGPRRRGDVGRYGRGLGAKGHGNTQ